MNVYWMTWKYWVYVPDCENQLNRDCKGESFVNSWSEDQAREFVKNLVMLKDGKYVNDLEITATYVGVITPASASGSWVSTNQEY
jgi:hypothetical protein